MRIFKSLSKVLLAAAVVSGITVFMSQTAMAAGDISIDETIFPDSTFRKYVENIIDLDKNGRLSSDEIDSVTSIDIKGYIVDDKDHPYKDVRVESLKGIELFTNLENLDCQGNKITTLDLSSNRSLETLYCGDNDLKNLDLSNNTYLNVVYCQWNKLTSLKVSNLPYLYKLKAYNNKLTTLDITGTELSANGVEESCYYDEFEDPDNPGMIIYTKESFSGSIVVDRSVVVNVGDKIVLCVPVITPTASPCPTNIPTVTPRVGITGTPTAKPTKSTLILDKKTANIPCGKTLSLKATLKGTSSKIVWKSSNTKIATVDANGKVTGKMAGQVTITATAAGKSAKCEVTVLYKDVTSSKDFWYAPTNYLTAKGVVKGYDKQTKFKPANDCTRAQMVTFLYRLQGEPKVKSTTCKFKDVKKTDYFYKPVIWASENGITTGVSKDKFDPQRVCTRAQTVTFLWRMAKKPTPKTAKNKFPDVKKTDYFYKATLWASEKKILAGLPDGTFNPQGKCLRRQMVTFLYKYDKFVNKKG